MLNILYLMAFDLSILGMKRKIRQDLVDERFDLEETGQGR